MNAEDIESLESTVKQAKALSGAIERCRTALGWIAELKQGRNPCTLTEVAYQIFNGADRELSLAMLQAAGKKLLAKAEEDLRKLKVQTR